MNYKVRNSYKPLIFLIDTVGSLLFFWKKLKKFNSENIKKIAVIRLDHLGDSILTFPFLDNLRLNFPNAEISVITRHMNEQILKYNKSIDKIISINAPWFSRDNSSYLHLLIFLIHNCKKFDLVFELHSDPRNIALASIIGKFCVGYSVRGFGFLLNHAAKYAEERKHTIERNIDLLRSLNLETKSSFPEINISGNQIHDVKRLFLGSANNRLVCISPCSGRQDKNWLNYRWAELCDELIDKYKIKIVFTGAKADESNIAQIIKFMRRKDYLNLCSYTSIDDLCAIIKSSKLVISPDSASIHIAKAVGAPSIALFSVEDPFVWGYNGKKNISLKKEKIEDISVQDIIRLIESNKLI